MSKTKLFSNLAAMAWLAALLGLGLYVSALEKPLYEGNYEDGEYPEILPSKNAIYVEDQYRARGIAHRTRRLEEDFAWIKEQYEKIEPFQEPADGKLTLEHVDKYVTAVDSYARDNRDFKKNRIGDRPSVFSVFAYVGMANSLYEYTKTKAFVKAGITEEEFDWIRDKILWAALFSAQYNLDHNEPTGLDKEHLEKMIRSIYFVLGIFTHEEQGDVFHPDRLKLDQVPVHDLTIFLDNYQRIQYQKVHFDTPTNITFDKEAILEAARNNTP